jgi:hypothetical protein
MRLAVPAILLGLSVPCAAQRAPLFQSEILPVLEKRCTQCHNPKQKTGGLDLTTFNGMMAGGSSGVIIVPGKAKDSLLHKVLESGKMPVGGKITPAEKQLIAAYIEQGRFPSNVDEAAAKARETAIVTAEARNWWAFRKPVKPAAPVVRNREQLRTPIDAFVMARLEEKGWGMQQEAGRVRLLRRVTLALLGLPPTPEEVKAFLEDRSANAYEKVVDRLLASPHYGEHWGRHWLDVAGYSDSRGDAGDTPRETLWKYRDYVIDAFNRNKPVDQFLIEQFAGDQLVNYKPGTTPKEEEVEALTATGFLRTTADITDNQTIYEVDKYYDAQQKVMETSLSAVLGLTIGCARCHDHKFDPILQRDYFRLMAAYQATWDPENWLAANLSFGPWPSRMIPNVPAEKREAWIKDVTSNDAKAIRRLDDLLEATYQEYRGELKAGGEMGNERRAAIRQAIEANPDLMVDRDAPKDFITDQELEKRYPELAAWKEEIQARRASRRKKQSEINPNFIEAAWDVSKTPSPTYILARGNYLAPTVAVEPGVPAVLDHPEQRFKFPDPSQHTDWNHTGRRLALAQWFVSRENPLTARVFVNRVWQFLFGEGIVRSVNDFGKQGMRPEHPELLDWLAVSFQEQGWDLKRLTKQIVMSQVYRQDSAEVAAYMNEDPSAKLLWRKPPLRLEAETIRDSMLQVSGLLNRKMHGPQEPIQRGPDGQWMEDGVKGDPNRRSIYLSQMRTKPLAFLHSFDAPSMTADSQQQRFRSSLPAQSLAMLNGPLVLRVSKAFAHQVLEQANSDYGTAVSRAFALAYSRPPSEREAALARNAIRQDTDQMEGLRLFLQAVLGANDFLYSY